MKGLTFRSTSPTQVSSTAARRHLLRENETELEFKLTYQLPDYQSDAAQLIIKLGAEGCTDALVGLGMAGLKYRF